MTLQNKSYDNYIYENSWRQFIPCNHFHIYHVCQSGLFEIDKF